MVFFFALISVLSKSENQFQTKKISRVSLRLGLGWLTIYSSLWLGSVLTNDLFSIRLMYLNGMFTTGYFFGLFIFSNKTMGQ